MKRKGYIFEQIADPDNLRQAFWKAQIGKSVKKDVIDFRQHLDVNLMQMRNQLMDGSFHFGKYHYFSIYEPKERLICAADFGERVVHHAIMNICAVDFENRQIPYRVKTNFSCPVSSKMSNNGQDFLALTQFFTPN